MVSEEHRREVAIRVCHLYYDDGLSQGNIANHLGLSRPTVSRLLQYARSAGLVRIEIVNPVHDMDSIEQKLAEKYGLRDVRLIYDISDDDQVIKEKLGSCAAEYLDEIVRDYDRIGISWGETLKAVADHLHPNEHKGVSVVQLKGSVAASDLNNFANDIGIKFGMAFGTTTMSLPLPVIFDDARTRDIVLKDRFIDNIVHEGIRANIAIFTSGTVRDDALLFRLGYLSQEEISIIQRNSVGDVLSRFIRADGSIANEDINNRTVGIQLNLLRDKPYSILVAGASAKLASMRAALVGGYANVLITDLQSGRKLLSD